jgi:anti-sigma B factor antagonist
MPIPGSSLQIAVVEAGDATTIKCTGKLVAGATGPLYEEVCRVTPQTKRVVLDFSDLSFMDSMGLGTVVRIYVHTKAAGVELQLVNVGKRIRDLLGMTHLLDVFTICGEHTIRIP